MRIKYIVPFPFGDEGIAKRAEQIPSEILGVDTAVECVAVRNASYSGRSYYDSFIFDMYVADAGVRAEEEGYDAVIMDSASDSALYVLRSRLSIPVLGPGLVSYATAVMLGKRFTIIAMLEEHKHLYEKTLDTYHLWEKCASIRAANLDSDYEELFTGDREAAYAALTEVGRSAVEQDGADTIVLGSTTMHQAGEYMSKHLDVPVINPGPVAIKMAEAIVQLGLSHSKAAFPSPPTAYDGMFGSLVGAD